MRIARAYCDHYKRKFGDLGVRFEPVLDASTFDGKLVQFAAQFNEHYTRSIQWADIIILLNCVFGKSGPKCYCYYNVFDKECTNHEHDNHVDLSKAKKELIQKMVIQCTRKPDDCNHCTIVPHSFNFNCTQCGAKWRPAK